MSNNRPLYITDFSSCYVYCDGNNKLAFKPTSVVQVEAGNAPAAPTSPNTIPAQIAHRGIVREVWDDSCIFWEYDCVNDSWAIVQDETKCCFESDLAISKEFQIGGVAVTQAFPGEEVDIVITVTNTGDDEPMAVIDDFIPNGFIISSSDPLAFAIVDGATQAVTITGTFTEVGSFVNLATVQGSNTETDPTNNTATAPIEIIQAVADIAFTSYDDVTDILVSDSSTGVGKVGFHQTKGVLTNSTGVPLVFSDETGDALIPYSQGQTYTFSGYEFKEGDIIQEEIYDDQGNLVDVDRCRLSREKTDIEDVTKLVYSVPHYNGANSGTATGIAYGWGIDFFLGAVPTMLSDFEAASQSTLSSIDVTIETPNGTTYSWTQSAPFSFLAVGPNNLLVLKDPNPTAYATWADGVFANADDPANPVGFTDAGTGDFLAFDAYATYGTMNFTGTNNFSVPFGKLQTTGTLVGNSHAGIRHSTDFVVGNADIDGVNCTVTDLVVQRKETYFNHVGGESIIASSYQWNSDPVVDTTAAFDAENDAAFLSDLRVTPTFDAVEGLNMLTHNFTGKTSNVATATGAAFDTILPNSQTFSFTGAFPYWVELTKTITCDPLETDSFQEDLANGFPTATDFADAGAQGVPVGGFFIAAIGNTLGAVPGTLVMRLA